MGNLILTISDTTLVNKIINHCLDSSNKIIIINDTTPNTTFNFSLWIPIFAAIIVGLFALYQVRSNTISNARINWIEKFSGIISDYCVKIDILRLAMLNHINEKNLLGRDYTDILKKAAYGKYLIAHNDVQKLAYLIRIYLVSEEKDCLNIKRELLNHDKKVDLDSVTDLSIKEFESSIDRIISNAEKIINQEWKKSKSYFFIFKKKKE
jgi:hypothetical protein